MATFAGGKIEAFAGPKDLGAPDDVEQAIVAFIAGATRSLDIAVQELDSEPIAQAILDARWRGVRVTVVPVAPRARRSCSARSPSGATSIGPCAHHDFVFHDKNVCAEYRREFDEIKRGEFGRRQLGRPPRGYSVGGVPVKVLFAPDHTPELEVVKQVPKAERRIDFAIFTFAGSSGIDDALLMAARAGRKVTGALDPGQAAHAWAAPGACRGLRRRG